MFAHNDDLVTRMCAYGTVLALAGCSMTPAAVGQCESLLLPTLKAPSTYKLIEHMIGQAKKNGSRNVFLTYDAANSYNAPIRGTFWCVIDENGVARLGGDDVDGVADNFEMTPDNLEALAD